MKNTGWEIKPLGWIALIMLVGTAVYFIFFHNKQKERQTDQRRKYLIK